VSRLLLAILFSASLSAVPAQRSHSNSRHSSTSKTAKPDKPDSAEKRVHVNSYKRKNRTKVKAYDRSSPGTKEKTPAR
jgi:hypothetical protein